MAYMAQQWVKDRVRDTYRDRRSEASAAASEARRVREWLASLELEASVAAVIDEPLAAMEEGLRAAVDRSATGTGAR